MTKPSILEFWFDPASTYAYLSAMRIEQEATRKGVQVDWRPFLLGPIFQAQGWQTSPFNIYPAKGRYMVRDIERTAEARGLPPFRLPDPFPARSVTAARVALVASDRACVAAFMRALFHAQFAEGRDIADTDVLRRCLVLAGVVDPQTVLAAAGEADVKDRLRRQTTRALDNGVFGAPTFVTPDGELFWGDDRLESALAWIAT